MAIPYYSMDITAKEALLVLSKFFSFRMFDGPAVKLYPELLKQEINVGYVCPTPSGRTAFYFLMKELFKPGDEVILSVFSFPLFAKILMDNGIKPVFVDVKDNALINEDLIEAKITPRTKGILITHLFGNACAMGKITAICDKHNLYLLEDCAHAFGSTYKGKMLGSFGKAAIFSTSPMKVPTTLGGGFFATNDEALYEKAAQALNDSPENSYGLAKMFKLVTFSMIYYLNSFPWIFSILTSRLFQYLNVNNPGKLRQLFYSDANFAKTFNPFERIKFSNLQAFLGLSQIARNPFMIEQRRVWAEFYDVKLKDQAFACPIAEAKECRNNYLYYIVNVSGDVDKLLDKCIRRGLFLMREAGWYCPQYAFAKTLEGQYPVGASLYPRLVRLPDSSLLNKDQIQRTLDTLFACFQPSDF